MQKKFLTTDEITHGYGIDEDTIQSLVEAGELKALADRGTWKYRRDEIEGLIKSGRLHPTKELPEVDDVEFDDVIGLASDGDASSAADYIELDEDALAEQQTFIRGAADEDAGPSDSESDVNIIFEDHASAMSDSDVRLAGDHRLAGSAPSGLSGDTSDSDVTTAPDPIAEGETGELDVVKPYFPAAPTEEIVLDEVDEEEHAELLKARGDEGSQETLSELPTDWSDDAGAVFAPPEDSGLTLEKEDSGLTLEKEDSGLTLEKDDSGLTLEKDDSGITLDGGDSGITLDAGDSGISLEAGDSGITMSDAPTLSKPVDPLAATEETFGFKLADDESDADRTVLAPPNDQTAVIDSMEDSAEFSPTLSGAIAAGEVVEDLEVSPDLDDVLEADDDVAEAEFDEEVLEADDEAFSEEYAATGDEDEELAAAPGQAKAYEPGWGAGVLVLAASAALLVVANSWLAFEGLSTMWTGADPSGPASSLISTLAGLM
jgi:hypothetical protein